MSTDWRHALWRLGIFLGVCLLGVFALYAVFGQLRFGEKAKDYRAVFSNVTGLESDDFVRIAGVEVGKVKKISIQDDTTALVEFTADDSVVLTEGNRAVIRYDDLIGGRYLALVEGTGGTTRLNAGDTIPLARTSPALDLDALIGGFKPLFSALDPDQVNALSGQLIQAFQGQGGTISSFLTQTAALTNTLADRDQLIGEVIVNLNTVLGSLGDQSDQFSKAVDALAELVKGLESRKQDISNGVAYTNAAAGSISDLLAEARPPFAKTIQETDRAAGIVVADHEYFDNLLNTLPDSYQALARQGIYGDFFSFYLCDLVLKLNGKGGQPGLCEGGRTDDGEVCAAMKPFAERNTLVMGAIGLGVTAAVVVIALQYDKIPFINQANDYSAYFAEAGGLTTGAGVQVSGLRVGEVSSIELDGPRVLVKFTVDNDVRIGDRSEAAIKTRGLLGTKVLEVTSRGDGARTARFRSSAPRRPISCRTPWAISRRRSAA